MNFTSLHEVVDLMRFEFVMRGEIKWKTFYENNKGSKIIKTYLWFVSNYIFQEAIIKILKMRKRITNAQLQTELVDILKNMFLPSKKMIKEQIEWLIEHKYMRRDEDDINTFLYMAWSSAGPSTRAVHDCHATARFIYSYLNSDVNPQGLLPA